METLKGQPVVVTGGSRGLGLGIVEALVEQQARVTVVARDHGRLVEVARRLGVNVIQGDVTDEKMARSVLHDIRPSVLVLNAGETPPTSPLHELTWENFSRVWDVDVKAGFYWLQAAIRLPLPRGSRVIIGSSGAAVNGSPLSGSYAGAKRMLWFMADYANAVAGELDLDIRCQAILPMQIIGDTELGRQAAGAYAKRKGISIETYLAGFGAPMPPRKVGENVVSILTDPRYETGIAFGMKGDKGIISLDK
ncbi:MAG: SDR family oxidoreductase [Chitinophagaceae bacterium]|nr:SDR family oxidoreductase [Chitinophagaceae bacterium]